MRPMRRLWPTLIALLGLALLAAAPASAAVAASIENRASGSASVPNNLVGTEPRLSEEAVREKVALAYELASDDAVAARGASSLVTYIPTIGRKFNQLAQRGWSTGSINKLVNNPFTTRAATNRATGNAATAFVRADGHYVVRDNVTGELVQMSDTRFTIGTGAGQWVPDSSIVDAFIPGP